MKIQWPTTDVDIVEIIENLAKNGNHDSAFLVILSISWLDPEPKLLV